MRTVRGMAQTHSRSRQYFDNWTYPLFAVVNVPRSMSELLHEAPPEGVRLRVAGIAPLFADRRVDHDEPAGGIDEDPLATDAGSPNIRRSLGNIRT